MLLADITVSLHNLTFYAAIFFAILGAVLGLMGVWVKDFWKNETAPKLLITDFIFLGTAVVVAAITKWLS